MLGVQDDAVCYAPQDGTDNHGIFKFEELGREVFSWQGSAPPSQKAVQAPAFLVMVYPMLVDGSGLLVPKLTGKMAVSLLQAPIGWGSMSDLERSKVLQGRLPTVVIVARELFEGFFVEMASIKGPQLLSPVFREDALELQGSGHFAATLEETLTGPTVPT